MASSSLTVMDFYLQYIIIVLLYAECTAGIIVNLFIVATSFQKWRTPNALQTCDKILSCLAISRCLLLFQAMLLELLLMFLDQLFQNPVLGPAMSVVTILLNNTNLWLTTILCVFYCVKITNYTHKLFLFLKTRISSLVHWFILASLIISVACSLPAGWLAFHLYQGEITQGSGENITFIKVMVDVNKQNQFLLFLGASFPPFLIFCFAIFLLINSLWIHIRNMRSSGTGYGSPHLEVHFCAVKSMSLFLVLHVIYFACMTVLLSPSRNAINTLKALVSIITCSPPFLHSLYIIFSNANLRETFLKCFCYH